MLTAQWELTKKGLDFFPFTFFPWLSLDLAPLISSFLPAFSLSLSYTSTTLTIPGSAPFPTPWLVSLEKEKNFKTFSLFNYFFPFWFLLTFTSSF